MAISTFRNFKLILHVYSSEKHEKCNWVLIVLSTNSFYVYHSIQLSLTCHVRCCSVARWPTHSFFAMHVNEILAVLWTFINLLKQLRRDMVNQFKCEMCLFSLNIYFLRKWWFRNSVPSSSLWKLFHASEIYSAAFRSK